MTEEIQTSELSSDTETEQIDVDYQSEIDILSAIQAQEEIQTELLNNIYSVSVLILGSFIVITVFRLLTSFLGRVFNDTTKF